MRRSRIVYYLTQSLALMIIVLWFLGEKPLQNELVSGNMVDLYYLTTPKPISHDNVLIFSIRVKNISDQVNKIILKENWKIPPVRLYDSQFSYKDGRQSWIVINRDFILFLLYEDVSSVLTTEEVAACVFHEIGHIKLGHLTGNPLRHRDTQEERAADLFAVRAVIKAGINPKHLLSAIQKLSPEGEEKRVRLEALLFI